MYLLAESEGPYMFDTYGTEQQQIYNYVFTKDFVLEFAYGDLSSNPELDILTIFVDLGPSMMFTQKTFF